jgi:hypothetical protein
MQVLSFNVSHNVMGVETGRGSSLAHKAEDAATL